MSDKKVKKPLPKSVSKNYNILSTKLDEIISRKPAQTPPRKGILKKESPPDIVVLGTVRGPEARSSSSFERRSSPKEDIFLSHNIPDRSKSDYYCRICDSHMNSEGMWESHVTGKRHLKNVKSKKLENPTKASSVKEVKVKGEIHPAVARKLSEADDAIVGLSYVTEIHRSPGVDPIYTCYLCQGCFTTLSILDHVVSSKHRFNYLKKVDSNGCAILDNMKLTKSAMDALISDKAIEWETKVGRGEMEIKIEKPKADPLPKPVPKRRRRFSEEDRRLSEEDRRLSEDRYLSGDDDDNDDDDDYYSSRRRPQHEKPPILGWRRGCPPNLPFDSPKHRNDKQSRWDYDYDHHDHREPSPMPLSPSRHDSGSFPMCDPARLPMSGSSAPEFAPYPDAQTSYPPPPSSSSTSSYMPPPPTTSSYMSPTPSYMTMIPPPVQAVIPAPVPAPIPAPVPAPAVNALQLPSGSAAVPNGFDLFSGATHFNKEIKIQLLRELSHPDITSEAEAREIMKCVNSLTQSLVQFKIKNLPAELQMRLAQEILADSTETQKTVSSNTSKNKSVIKEEPINDNHHDVDSNSNLDIISSVVNSLKMRNESSCPAAASDVRSERGLPSSSDAVKQNDSLEKLIATLRNDKILPLAKYDSSATFAGPPVSLSSLSTIRTLSVTSAVHSSEETHSAIPGLDLVTSGPSKSKWRPVTNEVSNATPQRSYSSVPRTEQYRNTQPPVTQASHNPYVSTTVSSSTYRRVPQENLTETGWQRRQNFDDNSSCGY